MQNKILIVEDQSKTTDIISTHLEEYGYITEIYHDTDELFSKFKAGAYILMILDLELSNTDGLSLYRKIREMDNNIVIFFLFEARRHCHEIFTLFPIWSFSNFFYKPIIARELIQHVLHSLDLGVEKTESNGRASYSY